LGRDHRREWLVRYCAARESKKSAGMIRRSRSVEL
jgi:hypothetical protein